MRETCENMKPQKKHEKICKNQQTSCLKNAKNGEKMHLERK